MTNEQLIHVQDMARQMRLRIVDMVGKKDGKVGHLGGSMSAADIVATLYFHKMKIDAANPADPQRDLFIMSKGHAALVQYAALALKGFFPIDELDKVKTLHSMLQGHPDMRKTPGIEVNTGSLGMGLSIGVGSALGFRTDGRTNKVYVLVGDGETQEGQVWEAAMAAGNYHLDNLVAIVDQNDLQATGPITERMSIGSLPIKFQANDWNVIEVDGHDIEAITKALDDADEAKGSPTVIIAKTVKGKSVSFAEGKAAFHNCSLTREQYTQAISDVDSYTC
jgi:Transketolase, N-terminal subunit